MSRFDMVIQGAENNFVRHAPHMLQEIFGSTEITPYWVADMPYSVASPIADELKRLANRGVFAYELDSDRVYQAIVDWNKRRHNLTLSNKNFVSMPGVLTGIAVLLRNLTEPGDGVLIQSPIYHQFYKVISSAGRKVVRNPLRYVNGRYEMDFDDLEGKLQSGKVKVILLCNPHNPIGRVWSGDELERLVAIADAHNVTIISDEIHADIVYAGHPFNSIQAIAPDRHVSVIGSPSKTFGMQSIASGYIHTANEAILEPLKEVVDSMYLGHGNVFTTYATITAFEKGDAWLDEFLTYLQATIAWIEAFIEAEMPGVHLVPVEGTYQIWLDFSQLGLTEDELKARIFGEAHQGLTLGSWFGQEGKLFMRMNIAAPLSQIQQSFEQLSKALQSESG